MNIDFIKWKVGYAEGFKWNEGCEPKSPIIEYDIYIMQADSPDLFTGTILYPLLNHRAVIGINKHSETWNITLYPFIVVVTDNEDINIKFGNGDIGQAQEKNIEQALEYVYEQEKNNEN